MTPFYQDECATLHLGDARAVLAQIMEGGVKTCVTSPPYWGLRDYGVPPSIWGGAPGCAHVWQDDSYRLEDHGDRGETEGLDGSRKSQAATRLGTIEAATCSACCAWRGCLGLEPTPDLYVQHLVDVFREVRRVMSPGGTLWLNLGDSYAGSWGAQGRQGKTGELAGRTACAVRQVAAAAKRTMGTGSLSRTPGLKPKDLVGIPWMVAFALRADGWWLRSDVIWAKGTSGQEEQVEQVRRACLSANLSEAQTAAVLAAVDPYVGTCMPESVRDRPTKAHEYVFLLAKSEHYSYHGEALREADRGRPAGNGFVGRQGGSGRVGPQAGGEESREPWKPGRGRNARSVWTVLTQPSGVEHFATMPVELARRCILAGTAPGDLVLDPFNGAGTTGLVSIQQGRRYVGVELNPRYAGETVQRWRRECAQAVLPLASGEE